MLNALIATMAFALPGDSTVPTPTRPEGGDSTTDSQVVEAAAALASKTTAFKASRVYLGDGRFVDDGIVLVKDGVILNVGAGLEIPAGASIVETEGCLSAGLIALHSNDGAGAELHDSTRVVLPDADGAHAFEPSHRDFKRARSAGITSIVLAPSSANLVGGQSVVVKTSGGKVLKLGAQLVLGLSSSALNYNKFPTSYAGAIGELERLFDSPEGAIALAAKGGLPVLLSVNDRAEILRAITFANKYHLKGALYGSHWAEDVVPAIKASGLAVICDPFDAGDQSRAMRSVVALANAGVRVGFGLDAPARSPESLRFGTALCIRAGLKPAAARKALTGDAAAIAGVGGRIGKISRGLDADLVLWSGDPVNLASSVEAVYIDGQRVHGGAK